MGSVILIYLYAFRYSHSQVIKQAQDLFMILKESSDNQSLWILQTCVRKICDRVETMDTNTDKSVLDRMENYQFSTEDRAIFTARWPEGLRIASSSQMKRLLQWIRIVYKTRNQDLRQLHNHHR